MATKLAFMLLLLVLIAPAASGQNGLICGDPTGKGCVPQYDGFEAPDLTFLTGRAPLGRHASRGR